MRTELEYINNPILLQEDIQNTYGLVLEEFKEKGILFPLEQLLGASYNYCALPFIKMNYTINEVYAKRYRQLFGNLVASEVIQSESDWIKVLDHYAENRDGDLIVDIESTIEVAWLNNSQEKFMLLLDRASRRACNSIQKCIAKMDIEDRLAIDDTIFISCLDNSSFPNDSLMFREKFIRLMNDNYDNYFQYTNFIFYDEDVELIHKVLDKMSQEYRPLKYKEMESKFPSITQRISPLDFLTFNPFDPDALEILVKEQRYEDIQKKWMSAGPSDRRYSCSAILRSGLDLEILQRLMPPSFFYDHTEQLLNIRYNSSCENNPTNIVSRKMLWLYQSALLGLFQRIDEEIKQGVPVNILAYEVLNLLEEEEGLQEAAADDPLTQEQWGSLRRKWVTEFMPRIISGEVVLARKDYGGWKMQHFLNSGMSSFLKEIPKKYWNENLLYVLLNDSKNMNRGVQRDEFENFSKTVCKHIGNKDAKKIVQLFEVEKKILNGCSLFTAKTKNSFKKNLLAINSRDFSAAHPIEGPYDSRMWHILWKTKPVDAWKWIENKKSILNAEWIRGLVVEAVPGSLLERALQKHLKEKWHMYKNDPEIVDVLKPAPIIKGLGLIEPNRVDVIYKTFNSLAIKDDTREQQEEDDSKDRLFVKYTVSLLESEFLMLFDEMCSHADWKNLSLLFDASRARVGSPNLDAQFFRWVSQQNSEQLHVMFDAPEFVKLLPSDNQGYGKEKIFSFNVNEKESAALAEHLLKVWPKNRELRNVFKFFNTDESDFVIQLAIQYDPIGFYHHYEYQPAQKGRSSSVINRHLTNTEMIELFLNAEKERHGGVFSFGSANARATEFITYNYEGRYDQFLDCIQKAKQYPKLYLLLMTSSVLDRVLERQHEEQYKEAPRKTKDQVTTEWMHAHCDLNVINQGISAVIHQLDVYSRGDAPGGRDGELNVSMALNTMNGFRWNTYYEKDRYSNIEERYGSAFNDEEMLPIVKNLFWEAPLLLLEMRRIGTIRIEEVWSLHGYQIMEGHSWEDLAHRLLSMNSIFSQTTPNPNDTIVKQWWVGLVDQFKKSDDERALKILMQGIQVLIFLDEEPHNIIEGFTANSPLSYNSILNDLIRNKEWYQALPAAIERLELQKKVPQVHHKNNKRARM